MKIKIIDTIDYEDIGDLNYLVTLAELGDISRIESKGSLVLEVINGFVIIRKGDKL